MSWAGVLLEKISAAFWGVPAILLFVGGGAYATVRLGFAQFRFLGRAFVTAFKPEKGKNSLSALAASLGAVMGPGNIVGVASALLLGGSGAIFWMWVSAWLGMALRYAESFLAVKYRVKKNGINRGGAMYVFREKGMRGMAVFFAVSGIAVSLIVACAVPSSAVGRSFELSRGIPTVLTGAVLSAYTAIVVFGGAKRIVAAAEVIVPAVCIFYGGISLMAFALHPGELINAFASIFTSAFSFKAGLGGLLGGAVRFGLSRGVFSHEAGMGTDPMFAASTNEEDPCSQGLVSMLGPFLDTVVFCSLTGVAVLIYGGSGGEEADLVRSAYSSFFPGFGAFALDAVLLLLVLATLSSWAFYGESCVYYLSEKPLWTYIYRGFYAAVPLFAAGVRPGILLTLGDIATACMAVPNVILCILFICEVKCPPKNRFISTSSVDKIRVKRYHMDNEKL